jgi:SAM-dependent methyltransferase
MLPSHEAAIDCLLENLLRQLDLLPGGAMGKGCAACASRGCGLQSWKARTTGFDSGTYDYFTHAIVGQEHSSRQDFTARKDDNELLQNSVDVILSNCVISLSPDKAAVFREAFRALKPGGRLAISDVVAFKAMPKELAESVEAMTGCVSGSAPVATLEALLREAGFEDVRIVPRPESSAIIGQCMPGAEGWHGTC